MYWRNLMFMKWKSLQLFIIAGALLLMTACASAEEDSKSKTASTGEKVEYEIVGIEPGTGIMDKTEEAFKEYNLSEDWSVKNSSGPVMTSELGNAIEDQKPIIVTGWKPHWKFSQYDLKFLEDPKKVYGEGNDVHTLVRKGLKEDLPGVYKFFDQFEWELSEQQEVMVMAEQDDVTPEEAARTWIEDNPELVKEWTKGAQKGNGQEVKVTLVSWADAIATTTVVTEILKDLGYEPEQVPVTINAMYAGLASKSVDGMFASWMPAQKTYYNDYETDFVDLGPNSRGTRIGLVVPEYMDVDSIEDLKE